MSPAEIAEFHRSLANVDALAAAQDLPGLRALSDALHARWAQKRPVLAAEGAVYLADALASRAFPLRDVAIGLGQAIAVRALTQSSPPSPHVAVQLAARLERRIDTDGKPLEGEACARERREHLGLYVEAWRRLRGAIDPKWKPDGGPTQSKPTPIPGESYADYLKRHAALQDQIEKHLLQVAYADAARLRLPVLAQLIRTVIAEGEPMPPDTVRRALEPIQQEPEVVAIIRALPAGKD